MKDSENNDLPIIIGIAGGSGSGKTTMARSIYEAFGKEENVTYLMHDSYYKDITHLSLEERANNNFDHPDALDTQLLIQHLHDLKANKPIEVPSYDFSKHARTSEFTLVHPKKIVLVEGILIFTNPALVDLLQIKVFIDTEPDIRFLRRMKRDMEERGRSLESVCEQYMKTVRPMHNEFVEPSKLVADVIIPAGRENASGTQMIIDHLKLAAGFM